MEQPEATDAGSPVDAVSAMAAASIGVGVVDVAHVLDACDEVVRECFTEEPPEDLSLTSIADEGTLQTMFASGVLGACVIERLGRAVADEAARAGFGIEAVRPVVSESPERFVALPADVECTPVPARAVIVAAAAGEPIDREGLAELAPADRSGAALAALIYAAVLGSIDYSSAP